MSKEEPPLYHVNVQGVLVHPRGIAARVHSLFSGYIVGKILEDPATGGKWLVLDDGIRAQGHLWPQGVRVITVKNLGKEELHKGMTLIMHDP